MMGDIGLILMGIGSLWLVCDYYNGQLKMRDALIENITNRINALENDNA